MKFNLFNQGWLERLKLIRAQVQSCLLLFLSFVFARGMGGSVGTFFLPSQFLIKSKCCQGVHPPTHSTGN